LCYVFAGMALIFVVCILLPSAVDPSAPHRAFTLVWALAFLAGLGCLFAGWVKYWAAVSKGIGVTVTHRGNGRVYRFETPALENWARSNFFLTTPPELPPKL